MNNKGQFANMGALITVAVAIIIGVVIFQSSVAPSVGTMTNTVTTRNVTYTFPAAGSSIDLVGQDLITSYGIYNATGGGLVATSNYTLVEANSPTTGVKTVRLVAANSPYNSKSVNVSYVYGDVGYVDDSGARGVVGLIPIMVALAIMVAALAATNLRDLFE